jgi:hypothetical protein
VEDRAPARLRLRRPRRWMVAALVGAAALVVVLVAILVLAAGPASGPGPASSPSGTEPSAGSSPTGQTSASESLPATGSPSIGPAPTPTGSAGPTPAPTARWHPVVGDTFQVQYEGSIDLSVEASVYDLDGDDTPAATVAALHASGRHVFCYIDAGAWESYRADASSYPKSVLGSIVAGWPQERWLDIRQIDALAPILRHRLDACLAKGFDGVDADNVDGFSNATGFPLKAADQLRFNRWLAAEAHARGLAIALKNDAEQVPDLVSVFDAAVVEECIALGECPAYSAFVAAGKPVFDIEYDRPPSAFCPVAASLHFEIVGKDLDLSVYRSSCED